MSGDDRGQHAEKGEVIPFEHIAHDAGSDHPSADGTTIDWCFDDRQRSPPARDDTTSLKED
jgi:hypothetical protein